MNGKLEGEIFEPLKNKEYFKNFILKYNTIEWENGADLAPEYLYEITNSFNWIKITKVKMEIIVLNWDLGKGESAVLSYALQKYGTLALIDDNLGKKCANILNIDVIGTRGLLVFAKKQGIIREVKPHLEQLKKAGE